MARAAGLLLLFALACFGQAPRFGAYDLWVDAGEASLAAWQIEVAGEGTIVGVEGGEHPLWREAPYYDPAALAGGRILLAAFTTGADAPAGRVHVARLHMRNAAGLETHVHAAARVGGERITVSVELLPSGEER